MSGLKVNFRMRRLRLPVTTQACNSHSDLSFDIAPNQKGTGAALRISGGHDTQRFRPHLRLCRGSGAAEASAFGYRGGEAGCGGGTSSTRAVADCEQS